MESHDRDSKWAQVAEILGIDEEDLKPDDILDHLRTECANLRAAKQRIAELENSLSKIPPRSEIEGQNILRHLVVELRQMLDVVKDINREFTQCLAEVKQTSQPKNMSKSQSTTRSRRRRWPPWKQLVNLRQSKE